MITWPLSTNPPPGACVIGIRDWALNLSRHRRLCEKLPSPLFHVITMPWNAYTSHTSGPPLHLQLSPTYPSGSTLINRARGPCVISEPQPDMSGSTRYTLCTLKPGFRICLCSCIAQWVPKRAPPPLLPLLWVLRSGQCAEIAPDLHATAAKKRGPFDRLQQHRCSPP